MTEPQQQYFLGVFNRYLEAISKWGDGSPRAEHLRRKFGPVLKNDPDFFTWLWERI